MWFLVKRQGDVALCAYNGRVLIDIPLLHEARQRLALVDNLVIACELIAPPESGRPRCHHVAAALFSNNGPDRLRSCAFDLVELGAEPQLNQTYGCRLQKIQQWLGNANLLSVVTTVQGSPADALAYYREWVGSQGFDGIVVREGQSFGYKIKPAFSIDAVVVAFGSRIMTGSPQLREMSVAIRRNDGRLHIPGSVGPGFAEIDRAAWHESFRD